MAPSFGAEIVDSAPMKLPMGVLAADTMTTSLCMMISFVCLEAKIIIF